jgi:hypothetical protein
VILQTEQLASRFLVPGSPYVKLLQSHKPLLADWSMYNLLNLTRRGLCNPVGTFPFLFPAVLPEELTFAQFQNRSIDVFFCGGRSRLREVVEQRLRNEFPDLEIHFDLSYSLMDSDKLRQKLLESKVVLNIPFYRDSALETHRINAALMCGCHVISLLSSCSDLNLKYRKWIEFTNDIVSAVGTFFFAPSCLNLQRRSFVHTVEKRRDLESLSDRVMASTFFLVQQKKLETEKKLEAVTLVSGQKGTGKNKLIT